MENTADCSKIVALEPFPTQIRPQNVFLSVHLRANLGDTQIGATAFTNRRSEQSPIRRVLISYSGLSQSE